jgi:hypothetical protein
MYHDVFSKKATTIGLSLVIIAALLSACSASASTPVPTVAQAPDSAPQSTATQVPTSAPQPTATQGPLDPCMLLPASEASTLAGASYGPGVEDNSPGGLKRCVYGAQTMNVFTVELAQAADVNAAKAAKAQFLSDLKTNLAQLTSEGFVITEMPDFADGAVLATVSVTVDGVSYNGSAIGFLKGTIFFGFADFLAGGPAPDSTALQNEATTVIGRL